MRIALDYDGTYTADPVLWDGFIRNAVQRGHEISVVTMRFPEEQIPDIGIPVIYTSRQAKGACFQADVWIDDKPHRIYKGENV